MNSLQQQIPQAYLLEQTLFTQQYGAVAVAVVAEAVMET
jgi:hypothetical protein